MKLLTKELEKQMPREDSKTVYCKFFTPDSNWTWYAMEYIPEDRVFFGLVDGHEVEYGYFSLDELETVRGPLGLKIERDRYFKKTPIKEIVNKLEKAR